MKTLLWIILPALCLLTACADSSSGSAPDPAAADQTERFNAALDSITEGAILREPEWASSLGRRDRYGEWNDYSDAATLSEIDIRSAELDWMESEFELDQLDEQAQISFELFRYKVEMLKKSRPYVYHSYPVEQMHGIQAELPSFLINVHRVENVLDAEAYVQRLQGVAQVMRQVVAKIEVRQEKGIVPPQFVFPYVLADSRNVIAGAPFEGEGNSILWQDFMDKISELEAEEEEKERLLEAGKTAIADSVGWAYGHLIACLEELETGATTEDGAWKFPDGAGYYQYRLEKITTTDMTADQIHDLGLEEVKRIHGEMQEIMQKVAFEGSLQDFFAFMRTDPQFYLPNTPEGRDEYLTKVTLAIDQMREKLPDFFLNLPEAELTVKRVEPYREKSAGKAFYNRPAPDGSRPGIYYANLYDMANMPTYQMEALAFHEAIPGHHMQLSRAIELQGLPDFRKYTHYTSYVEGWALYSEKLAKEMGFYEDPYADFGRRAMELWRACRLVVDTGIHSKQWPREKAIQYLRDNTPNPEGDIVKAIERYIVMPGQATAYKIGMLKIEELRAEARNQIGDAWGQENIKEFHEVILANGAVPLTLLEQLVQSYVDGQLNADQAQDS